MSRSRKWQQLCDGEASVSRFVVPPVFARRITAIYGAQGEAWLAELPDLMQRCARRWSLTLKRPFPDLTYNYVIAATRADGLPVVLKLGVVNRELITEIHALRLYAGQGAVRLLDAVPEAGALLLEQLYPGTPLSNQEDDARATAVAAHLMQQLWRPPVNPEQFPTVADWLRGFGRLRARYAGGVGLFPRHLVELAETLATELQTSAAPSVLLHGDLHHKNILQAQRAPWLAIDPKGIIGEAAYETGSWLRNPFPQLLTWPQVRQVLARRVAQFAEILGFEPQRVIGWGVVQAVLSAWWSLEDNENNWEWGIRCAELLASLL
ncbi:MAG: hypothetical protein D6706_10420 [Chloroflexi bacterium]|nr:MAG: hypothetical protein D6706_10420 [Chloroflexota bacterium]